MLAPIKIVITANTSWYLYNFRRSTIRMLIDNGYQITCIAPDSGYKDKLEKLGASFEKVFISRYSTNPYYELKTIFSYIKLYGKRYQLILNFTPKCNIYSTLAATFYQIPTINNISGQGIGSSRKGITTSVYNYLNKITSKLSKFIFFQNIDDLNFFVKKYNLNKDKTKLLPGSGVNLDEFPYTSMTYDSPLTFGMFSRMIEEKGVRIFAEAAKELKNYNINFVMAGAIEPNHARPISLEEIEQWEKNSNLTYKGMLDNVKSEMAKCHCIILPSYYAEGTPRSLIEGLSLGKIIITTDMPGCRDTVNKTNGIIIKSKDIESLKNAILDLIKRTPINLTEMSKASRKIAEEKFDEKIILNQYIEKIKYCLTLSKLAREL